MEPMSQREREIMMLQTWGEIPRRRWYDDPMVASIYDEEDEEDNGQSEDL